MMLPLDSNASIRKQHAAITPKASALRYGVLSGSLSSSHVRLPLWRHMYGVASGEAPCKPACLRLQGFEPRQLEC